MDTQQKKVTFNKRVKRRFIERASSIDQPNLWYNSSDFAEARASERVLRSYIQQFNYDKLAETLASEAIFTSEEIAIKNITIANSILAVLDEQDRQEAHYDLNDDAHDEPFVLDHKEIEQEYRVHSRVSLAQAQNRARLHAMHMKKDDLQSDEEILVPPPPPQGNDELAPTPRPRSRGRSPTLSKTKMSLVRRRTQYGRQMPRGEAATEVVKCTTPAA